MEYERKSRPWIPVLVVLVVFSLLIGGILLICKLGKAFIAASYQNKYNELVALMLDEGSEAEDMGNLIVAVWHNAIYSTSDVETDKYTKENGKFVSDFNDALANLFFDPEYSKREENLRENQLLVREQMKEMLDPPDGFENAFKALENMYLAYIRFTDHIIECNGSYDSFSSEFSDRDHKLSECYTAAELYVR